MYIGDLGGAHPECSLMGRSAVRLTMLMETCRHSQSRFYVLTTYMAISERVLTCDSVHSHGDFVFIMRPTHD